MGESSVTLTAIIPISLVEKQTPNLKRRFESAGFRVMIVNVQHFEKGC